MGTLRRRLKHLLVEYFELQTDASRALRAAVAFTVPLFVCHRLNRPNEAVFICMAAQNLARPDLRGAYRIRLSILATFTLVASASALLGVICAGNMIAAVAAMGVVALGGGVWRHLSADYGQTMSVSSALLFLLGLAQPGGWPVAWHLAILVVLGGAIAGFMHVCFWLVRPQQALRHAVAETWVAASDLLAAMRTKTTQGKSSSIEPAAAKERELRAALDRTFLILGAAENRKQTALIAHLEAMRREVVHLTMRAIALNASLESILEQPDFARCLPVVDSVLKALSDAARSVAITLVMPQPSNFAASSVRLKRCQHLIKALDEQIAALPAGGANAAQVRAALEQITTVLPRIQSALGETADHAASRLDFSAILPDMSARSIKSLGSWMRPISQLDPVLVRHSVRMAAFTMFAVALYKGFNIERGYWIAFTIMVVLQPDYGSTRKRAAARIGGTVAGSILASALLWIKMPLFALDTLAGVAVFFFAYFVRRHYWIAIFFVTIVLVLITGTRTTVHGEFMLVRVGATLLGGGLALVAARVFWPVWEGEKFPALLASAIRANRAFLQSLSAGFGMTSPKKADPLLAKRRAENADRYVAASVERLQGEPSSLQEKVESAAALATYNQRVTRALTVLAVQLPENAKLEDPSIATVVTRIGDLLEKLAQTVEKSSSKDDISKLGAELANLEEQLTGANFSKSNAAGQTATLTWIQLAKTIAEIRAMTLALEA